MKVLQLTNTAVPAVATNANMPLGITTVRCPIEPCGCTDVFTVSSSAADTININKSGTYRLDYSASVIATAAGIAVLTVIVNGVDKYSVSATAAVGATVNLTIPLELYIPCNCALTPNNIPAYIQIKNTGVALTSGTSNLIMTKC